MSIVRVASLIVADPSRRRRGTIDDAERFYQRSSALLAKGPLVNFSRGEISTLMTEAQNAGEATRASCPPQGSNRSAAAISWGGLGPLLSSNGQGLT